MWLKRQAVGNLSLVQSRISSERAYYTDNEGVP